MRNEPRYGAPHISTCVVVAQIPLQGYTKELATQSDKPVIPELELCQEVDQRCGVWHLADREIVREESYIESGTGKILLASFSSW